MQGFDGDGSEDEGEEGAVDGVGKAKPALVD